MRPRRLELGLSLRCTARAASVAPSHLSRAERGEKRLSVDALYRVAVVLQIDELVQSLSPYVEQEGP